MAKAVGGGLGVPLPYEFVPGAIGYDPSVPTYEYNVDKAKQLLAESGVTLPLTVRLTAHNREQDQQQAQLFVEAQKLMHESAWFGYMWFENGSFLVHKRIQGFTAPWGGLREAELWINE